MNNAKHETPPERSMGLESLNDVQRKAVQHKDGPLLLLSGAGSGKTRVITHRIAYLIHHHGVSPFNILAVTFTKKATEEMKTRLNDLIGKTKTPSWIHTFHSCCTRILHKHITHLGYGYDSSFTTFDDAKQRTLIKNLIRTLHIRLDDLNAVLAEISKIKRAFISPEQYADMVKKKYPDDKEGFFEKCVAQIYPKYQDFLRENNALDFDDMITLTVEVFDANPNVLESYQNQFRYILVDEYQDTDNSQYQLVSALAQKHQNICVVGDDDQSIYSFRGADINNILDFERDYPDAKVLCLGQNYRSTKNIVDAANAVISNNQKRKEKPIKTENERGSKITCYGSIDPADEAGYVLRQIQKWKEHGKKYEDLAILYRINAQSRAFEDALRDADIPYRIVGGIGFYERMEVKDIVAYMQVIVNPTDTVSIKRIINTPRRGIGVATVQKIEDFADKKGISLFEAIQRVGEVPTISNAAKNSVRAFDRLITSFNPEDPPTRTAEDLLERSSYLEVLRRESTIEAQSREENLGELIAAVTEHEKNDPKPTLKGFLEKVASASASDDKDDKSDRVTMMTLHGTKGLEFPIVFMVGMEEGLLPHWRSCDTEADLEEERRLCYVGITRAEEQLYLTHSYSRGPRYPSRSRFINEIPEELLQMERHNEVPNSTDDRATEQQTVSSDAHNVNLGDDFVEPTDGVGKEIQSEILHSNYDFPEVVDESKPTEEPTQQPEVSVDVYLNRGDAFLGKGNYDFAIEAYDKAIELKPDFAVAYSNRGQAYAKKGDYPRAVANYDTAIGLNPSIELPPNAVVAYNIRGAGFLGKGNYDRAIVDYTKAIQLKPNYIYAYYNRGQAYYKNRDYDRAIVDYTEVIQLKSDHANAYFFRGEAYRAKGDYHRATENYDKAIELKPSIELPPKAAVVYNNRGVTYAKKGDYLRAIADYTRAIELQPNYATAYNNRGRAYRDTGDYPRATADYTKAIVLKPDYDVVYNNRGAAYAKKGDYPRAIADYTKAIELKPDFAVAYNNRGAAYAKKDDYPCAAADYDKATELNPSIELPPNAVDAYSNRGTASYERGDYENAIGDYTKAIKLKPDYTDVYYNRGWAYYKQGDYPRAAADYDKATELRPSVKLPPNAAVVYFDRGKVYSFCGENVRAIADYTKAIELEPDDADAYNNRGRAYHERGDYPRAAADYDKAIELRPSIELPPYAAVAYYNRGWVYYFNGENALAIANYTKAIELEPDYASVYLIRGWAYCENKDYDNAIGDYTKIIELKPNAAYAYLNRAQAYHAKSDYPGAASDYTKTIELKPSIELPLNAADAYLNSGATYYEKGDYNHAIGDYTKAIELKSDFAEAYVGRGDAYREKGDYSRAATDYDKATELNPSIELPPDAAQAYNNRGMAYREKGENAPVLSQTIPRA